MPSQVSFKPTNGPDVHGIPYDDVTAGKPPIPITVAPTPSSARLDLHPSLRPQTSPEPSLDDSSARSKLHDDVKRDSGFTASNSAARDSRTTFTTDTESGFSVRNSRSVKKSRSFPRFHPPGGSVSPSTKKFRRWNGHTNKALSLTIQSEAPKLPEPIVPDRSTGIPSISFEDLTSPEKIEFSKRGSILISGRKASEISAEANGQSRANSRSRRPITSTISTISAIPARILSTDEELQSQKVRSMYEGWADDSSIGSESFSRIGGIEEEVIEEESGTSNNGLYLSPSSNARKRGSTATARRESFVREEQELAGGIEDWHDVNNGDVDRYGFIVPRSAPNTSSSSPPTSPEPRLHRVSTALQLASETPRRNYSRLGRTVSITNSTRSVGNGDFRKVDGQLIRPGSSQSSYRSTNSRPVSRMRSAANRLPHNRGRRFMDEAGDMLTLPPGLADIVEQEDGGREVNVMRRKELEREEKWRKMAKVVRGNKAGGGMEFEFDTKSPKLISRTWKGIPDRWRATAWHAFLTASAKKRRDTQPTDAELMACFDELVDQSSPDDVQIDIDVPRTISSHIMFRRRYRGGQRLLFRVLHCLSLYFPQTGYVQGMAALAATFLCYFEESMAFIMLVRMWQLRGLDRLYKSGFAGLMDALDEFEKKWMAGGSVAAKLVSLPTSAALDEGRRLLFYMIPRKLTCRAFSSMSATNIDVHPDRPECLAHCLWYPLVPYRFQLLHSLPCPTPRLGCLSPPRRS